MPIPRYPDFVPVSLEHINEMHPRLSLTPDGVSEFTFAGLYLFRRRYQYRVCLGPDDAFIISGVQPPDNHGEPGRDGGGRFFCTPCAAPPAEILDDLFRSHDYWKNIPASALKTLFSEETAGGGPKIAGQKIEIAGEETEIAGWEIETAGGDPKIAGHGAKTAGEETETTGREIEIAGRKILIAEDRGNFDYLYFREELASLTGKRFHKKKNLVNAFKAAFPDHDMRVLTGELVPRALEVTSRWAEGKGGEGDAAAARESLELFDVLPLRGAVFYAGERPIGWCLGESVAKGRIFTIHFEKALDEFKGVYQYINQAFAASLPRFFTYINREQDLGDPGLRQAKETYRPCGFVRKYIGRKV